MLGVSVYEISKSTFRSPAQSARSVPAGTLLLPLGSLSMAGREISTGLSSATSSASRQPRSRVTERPDYFLKEVKQDKQMNYLQLASYINDLQQSGFDTVKLQVQYHKKFSVPVFALIMAMLSIPFGFLIGNRGAMTGIGVSIAIAMAYWGTSQFFEQLGDVSLLPPAVSAWAPDALFALAGSYLLLRMRS